MSQRSTLAKLRELPPPYNTVTEPLPAYGKSSPPGAPRGLLGGGGFRASALPLALGALLGAAFVSRPRD